MNAIKFQNRIQFNTEEFMNGRLLNSKEIFKHKNDQQTWKVRDLKRIIKEAIKPLIGR